MPSVTTSRSARSHTILYDDRGLLISYSTGFLPRRPAVEVQLRRWEQSNRLLTDAIFREGARRGKPTPVVFFAVQDPFVNTNSVALLAQERGVSLPIGLLVPPDQAGESFAIQMQDPRRGVPDLVILGAPSTNAAAAAFSPLPASDVGAARRAAQTDGFREQSTVALPDGRRMQLWWRREP